jgi:hypothetical protein
MFKSRVAADVPLRCIPETNIIFFSAIGFSPSVQGLYIYYLTEEFKGNVAAVRVIVSEKIIAK